MVALNAASTAASTSGAPNAVFTAESTSAAPNVTTAAADMSAARAQLAAPSATVGTAAIPQTAVPNVSDGAPPPRPKRGATVASAPAARSTPAAPNADASIAAATTTRAAPSANAAEPRLTKDRSDTDAACKFDRFAV
jgi:hypothetical protein